MSPLPPCFMKRDPLISVSSALYKCSQAYYYNTVRLRMLQLYARDVVELELRYAVIGEWPTLSYSWQRFFYIEECMALLAIQLRSSGVIEFRVRKYKIPEVVL